MRIIHIPFPVQRKCDLTSSSLTVNGKLPIKLKNIGIGYGHAEVFEN